jgi:hypothetical protein
MGVVIQMSELRKARKLHDKIKFQGLPVSIENRKGSYRYWHSEDGGTPESGRTLMLFPYGYVKGSMGNDGDHVDVFIGNDKKASYAYVIDQMKRPDFNTLDEQKVMLGFATPDEAKTAYMAHFNDKRFFGSMKAIAMDDFKAKVQQTSTAKPLIKALRDYEEPITRNGITLTDFIKSLRAQPRPTNKGSNRRVVESERSAKRALDVVTRPRLTLLAKHEDDDDGTPTGTRTLRPEDMHALAEHARRDDKTRSDKTGKPRSDNADEDVPATPAKGAINAAAAAPRELAPAPPENPHPAEQLDKSEATYRDKRTQHTNAQAYSYPVSRAEQHQQHSEHSTALIPSTEHAQQPLPPTTAAPAAPTPPTCAPLSESTGGVGVPRSASVGSTTASHSTFKYQVDKAGPHPTVDTSFTRRTGLLSIPLKKYQNSAGEPELIKAGPFIGPRGGKWQDAQHTIPWQQAKSVFKPGAHKHAPGALSTEALREIGNALVARMGDKPKAGKRVEAALVLSTGTHIIEMVASANPARAQASRSADGVGGHIKLAVPSGARSENYEAALRGSLAHEAAHAADKNLAHGTNTIDLHDEEHAKHPAERVAIFAEAVWHLDNTAEHGRELMRTGLPWKKPAAPLSAADAARELVDNVPSRRALVQSGAYDDAVAYVKKLLSAPLAKSGRLAGMPLSIKELAQLRKGFLDIFRPKQLSDAEAERLHREGKLKRMPETPKKLPGLFDPLPSMKGGPSGHARGQDPRILRGHEVQKRTKAGWTAIPGGKRGGMRKRGANGRWQYWYPDAGLMKSDGGDRLPGGLADKKKPRQFDAKSLAAGIRVEMEHTDDRAIAREIAMDHLTEDPKYYQKLKMVEKGGADFLGAPRPAYFIPASLIKAYEGMRPPGTGWQPIPKVSRRGGGEARCEEDRAVRVGFPRGRL